MRRARAEWNQDILTIYLFDRIDSLSSSAVEEDVLKAVKDPSKPHRTLVFDARELEYISSSGLRVLLKAVKEEERLGHARVRMVEASRDIADILDTTGFSTFIEVQKAYPEISVEGCRIIGKGASGTVYQYDEDTIVKVFHIPDDLAEPMHAIEISKNAFLSGLPTPITYNIVRVGRCYGAVFELLNAQTFNDLLLEQPDKIDETLKLYTDLIRKVHSVEMDTLRLPLAKDRFLEELESVREYFTDGQYEKLEQMLRSLPEDHHVVHGDFQMKNVMMCSDGPMLIDLDTLSLGQPIFDLQALYVTYEAFEEDEPGNNESFLGIPDEICGRIWEKSLENYYDEVGAEGLTEEEKAAILDRVLLLSKIHFLYVLLHTLHKEEELTVVRISHIQKDLAELIERVDRLE